MKVVLKQDVKGSGKAGDVVTVSDGYARNFLIPKGFAVEANAQSLNEIKQKKAAAEHKIALEIEEAKHLQGRIHEKTVRVTAKGGEGGKLFGKITAKDVADAIKHEFNAPVDKKKVSLGEDIRSFGTYTVEVKLYKDIVAKVYVMVTEE